MDNNALELQNLNLQDVWKGKKSGVEENVKIIIVLPLLELLGFDRQKDMDFEHYIENKRADIALLVEDLPKVVVECKSLEKNLDDFISQALGYAIKESIPYILLTNGREFRLYKSFIENIVKPKDRLLFSAHLKNMESDIVELKDWISKEALTKKRIDRKADKLAEKLEAEITPITLIENLRSAKELLTVDAESKILPTLGNDLEFRKLVDEWISDSDLDISKTREWVEILANEISYSFINRLYFVRIAQDKGIVKQKLTKQAISQITQYLDYKDLMKTVFEEILRIDYQAIFKHDIFDKINFSEGVLKRIVDNLASYNFAKINSDIIGRIYEYHVSRDERKKLGQFYTPEYIIDYILDTIPLKGTDRLLDPACGSGGFLIRAYDKFLTLSKGKKHNDLHRQILDDNIFGYDINPFAVHLTGMNLALKNIESKTEALNILECDSLAGNLNDFVSIKVSTLQSQVREMKRNERIDFDIVVGNPPYFNLNSKQIEEKYSTEGFDSVFTGVTNIAALFLSKYIHKVKPGGYLGFVLPKSITYSTSWRGIRKTILMEAEIIKIFDVHEAFDGVLLEQIALVVQKRPCPPSKIVEVKYRDLPYPKKDVGPVLKHHVDAKLFNENEFPIYCYPTNEKFKKKCLEGSRLLESISDSPRGVPIQRFKHLFTDIPMLKDDKRVLCGDDLKKYGLKSQKYVSIDRSEFKQYSKKVKELSREKILVQNIIAQTGNHLVIIATLDDSKSIDNDTVNNIILNDSDFDYKYVLGILNSRLAEYYAFNFIYQRAVRTMHFESARKIPIKIITKSKQKKLVDLVEAALKENDLLRGKEVRRKIDEEVYSIYNLSKSEVEMVEGSYRDHK